jgi:hydroxymethylbilane synthase
LALAQANHVLAKCRQAFPGLAFELNIVKTTGDKLQTASLANPQATLPKGLFTKELEVALLNGDADLAVHSLKDLPTDLPPGLVLGAVGKRADVRDVWIYRDAEQVKQRERDAEVVEWSPGQPQRRGFRPGLAPAAFPAGTVVATSSTRRQAQVRHLRPDFALTEIRGNVPTRLHKLAEADDFDVTILAAAGLERLQYVIRPNGRLTGKDVPPGLFATRLDPELMLPCVGQAAIGIEVREGDERLLALCPKLNHFNTRQAVVAERAFLHALGGGCQSPVAAYAVVLGHQVHLRAQVFDGAHLHSGEDTEVVQKAEELGRRLGCHLKTSIARTSS